MPDEPWPAIAAAPDADWRDLALCTEVDGELFFPEKGQPSADAKRVCGLCEVRSQCLNFAMDNDIRFGVWGGTSELDRRKLRSARAREALDNDSPRDRAGAAQAA